MSLAWEDAVPGAEPPPRVLGPLTRTDFVRYQGASGDLNPIHHDELFARAAGFDAPVGVGMLHAGAMASWATDWLGPDRLRRLRLRWKRPVWPGDVLTLHGRILERVESERRVELELSCVREPEHACGRSREVLVCQGWATFVGLPQSS